MLTSTILAGAVYVMLVIAQDLNSVGECGKTCITKALQTAKTQYGCGDSDASCHCVKADFTQTVSNCAVYCTNFDSVMAAINYAVEYCMRADRPPAYSVPTAVAIGTSVIAIPTSTSAITSAGATEPTISFATSTSGSNKAPASGGLSTPAKIGIGVGVPLAVVTLFLLGFCTCKYKIQLKQREPAATGGALVGAVQNVQNGQTQVAKVGYPSQWDAKAVHVTQEPQLSILPMYQELPANVAYGAPRMEMETHGNAAELPGNTQLVHR